MLHWSVYRYLTVLWSHLLIVSLSIINNNTIKLLDSCTWRWTTPVLIRLIVHYWQCCRFIILSALMRIHFFIVTKSLRTWDRRGDMLFYSGFCCFDWLSIAIYVFLEFTLTRLYYGLIFYKNACSLWNSCWFVCSSILKVYFRNHWLICQLICSSRIVLVARHLLIKLHRPLLVTFL